MPQFIEIRQLTKTYRSGDGATIAAADHIDLDIARGETLALTGPSGSGKSTVLHLLGALDTPDSGHITVDGKAVVGLSHRAAATYRSTVGFVFQRFNLLPTLTAIDNVLTPVLPLRTDWDKRARARELLTAVNLDERAHTLVTRLSGGQQQRVAIARAMINNPHLILADEPTGNLDSHSGKAIIDLLIALAHERATTIVFATHDADLARRCTHIREIHDGQLSERINS